MSMYTSYFDLLCHLTMAASNSLPCICYMNYVYNPQVFHSTSLLIFSKFIVIHLWFLWKPWKQWQLKPLLILRVNSRITTHLIKPRLLNHHLRHQRQLEKERSTLSHMSSRSPLFSNTESNSFDTAIRKQVCICHVIHSST